jgi:hypothetical protein
MPTHVCALSWPYPAEFNPIGNPLNPGPESARWRSGLWPCHSVYRETARLARMISLLDFLTAPATISNKSMQLHSPQSNYVHSAHIAKLDHTLKVPDCTTCFQAFGCFPYTFAPFQAWRFSLLFTSFTAVALSLQYPFRCRTSFALDAAGLRKRPRWLFEVDFCSDAASLLHPPVATFTTLCEYREDSPAYDRKASSTEQYKATQQKQRFLENQLT